VLELRDAGLDAILYACLIALTVGRPGEHQRLEAANGEQLPTGDANAAVLSSAGALTEGLRALSARRIERGSRARARSPSIAGTASHHGLPHRCRFPRRRPVAGPQRTSLRLPARQPPSPDRLRTPGSAGCPLPTPGRPPRPTRTSCAARPVSPHRPARRANRRPSLFPARRG
jgi:hypothetical protein